MRWLIAIALWIGLSMPVAAIDPEEIMSNPVHQTRALALYDALRCVQCRSETIASSNADWAVTARAVVRERILAGDGDQDVLSYFQARYGDYVLMDPPINLRNMALWLAGPALLLVGFGFALTHIRGQRRSAGPEGLTEDEQARLDRLLRD